MSYKDIQLEEMVNDNPSLKKKIDLTVGAIFTIGAIIFVTVVIILL